MSKKEDSAKEDDAKTATPVPDDVKFFYVPLTIVPWTDTELQHLPFPIKFDVSMGEGFIPVFYDLEEMHKHYPESQYKHAAFRRVSKLEDE